MALPGVGGGYQLGDGNLNEIRLGYCTPVALTADTTLTAAQLTAGVIAVNKGSDAAVTLTLPTATATDTLLTAAKVGSTFDVAVSNHNNSGSSSTVTISAGTGWTLNGNPAVGRYAGALFRAVKTGTAAWTLYTIG